MTRDPFNWFLLSLTLVVVGLSLWFTSTLSEPEPAVLVCDELVVELKDSTWVRLVCNDGTEVWGVRQ